MVARVHRHNRFAFTLIELIFAIVIIAISVISLPMMTQATSRGIDNNIVQEAIFAASAELMGASAGYWDTNSMSDNAVSHLSRVIDIGSTCVNNNLRDDNRLRAGHIAQPLHRRCIDANIGTIAPADAPDNVFINLNNAAHPAQIIFTDNLTHQAGYKESYDSIVTVDRNNSAPDNNVKHIEITILESNSNIVITRLRMQSANIGEVDYFHRRF